MDETPDNHNPDRIKITFFQRRPRPTGNFSLEFIFDDVRKRLRDKIDASVEIAPYYSNGFFRRLAICFHAWRSQAGINHVTGDITFAAIGLSPDRTAVTILDCGTLPQRAGLKRWLIQQVWFKWPVRRATAVTTISSSVRNEIIELTGCKPQKVRIVPVAVSDSFSKNEKQFSKQCPRILHLGTAPNKNLPRLVNALRSINCTLVVIGKIDSPTIKLIKQNGVHLENCYNLSQEEVVQQYCRADLVAFVSTYEGFGMPIIEANVVGRPVVTGNVSSMPEVAGNAACLVDPFDIIAIREGIERIIGDDNYREALIANGFKNAKRFHPDKIARMYLDVYEEIASGNLRHK